MSYQLPNDPAVVNVVAQPKALMPRPIRTVHSALADARQAAGAHHTGGCTAPQPEAEFLPFVAHELRNSLAVIRTAARLLRAETIDGAALLTTRHIIERHLEQMSELVDKLLTSSRDQSEQLRLELARVDLRVVVARALQSAEPTIRQRRQRLAASESASPIWLVADATRLEQVFVNLLSNASKYTDAEGAIQLSMERSDGGAVIRILDTGIGIEPQLLPHVFDLFVQGPATGRQTQAGSGVGLALVRALVVAHGGSVNATSAGAGTGSEFAVWLPVAREGRLATGRLTALRSVESG